MITTVGVGVFVSVGVGEFVGSGVGVDVETGVGNASLKDMVNVLEYSDEVSAVPVNLFNFR